MPLNFPSSGLTANETTYTFSGNTWIWNGYAWDSVVTPASVGISGYVSAINGRTGAFGLTGTANEVEITGATSFVVGLPDSVIINNLTVTGGITFGPYSYILGEEFAPNIPLNPVTIDSAKVQIGDVNGVVNGLKFIVDSSNPDNNIARLYGNLTVQATQAPYGNGGGIYSSSLNTDNIIPYNATTLQIANATTRVNIGDDGEGNGTKIYLRDMTRTLDLMNPNGSINIGDVNGVGNSTKLTVNDTTNTVTVNGNLTVTGGATFGGPVTINGGTAWHSLNDGKDSGLDADLVHGVGGRRFTDNLQTGLLHGGVLSINAGNTGTFNVSAGSGIVVDVNCTTGSAPDPIVTSVSWSNLIGVTLPGLTSQDLTFISINSSGQVVKSNVPFTESQYETEIPLGALVHPSRAYISFAKTYPHVAYGQSSQMDPFVRAFGPLKLSGHEISGSASTLQLIRTSGTSYALGRNYTINPESPNIVADTNANPVSVIYRTYRNGSGGFTTVVNSAIDPDKYDDGTGTPATVPPGNYSIKRLFFYPGEPSVIQVYLGRAKYNSIDAAKAALPYEQFSESADTADSAIFCGYLIIKGGATNFSNSNDYLFVQGGLFRNTSNIGGGGIAVASIDDLTDVTITSAANNDLLRYNSTTSQWVNTAITSLPIAVTGANTFTGLQTMNAGITANNLWITNGATFAARSTFVNGLSADTLWATNGVTFNSNLYAGTIKGGLLNVQNTGNNLLGDVTGVLGGGYIQVDNSSGVAVNKIVGTVYTDQIRAGGAVSVTGAISASTTITATGRMSNAGMTATGAVAFTSSVTANNLYVSQGATFAATVQGVTASFTGLVSSSSGFSGAGTNLNGNASGLTAGTSSKSIIADTNSSSTHYPVFVSATGNIALNVDSATTPFTYVPSTGALTSTSIFATNAGISDTLSVAKIQEYTVGGGLNITTRANFSGGINVTGGTFSGAQTFVNGATFSGNISAPNIVNTVNGITGAVITYVGTTGNIPYRYGSGVGITANDYFTVAANLAGSQTDLLKFYGATSFVNPGLFGDLEAKGLIIDRFYNSLGLDEGGGVEIRALGQMDDGGGGVLGSNLILTTPTPTTSAGSVILAPTNVQVLIAEPTAVSVYATLYANSGVDIGIASQMIRNGSGAVSTLDYQTTTTAATTANQNIASWIAITDTTPFPPTVPIRSMEITVQAENNTTFEYERVKFLVIHDNTNTYLTEISDIRTGKSLATYSTTLTTSGTTKILYLRATPANASSTIFKVTTSQISSGIG